MTTRSHSSAVSSRRASLRVVPSGLEAPRPEPPGVVIVGVGASAGGLDAFRELLAHVPADSDLAFVLVQHLEATRASLLSDALAQVTGREVTQAEQGMRIASNRVYVIPPGVQMAVEQGALKLSPLEVAEQRPHLPIDFFLRSLASERGGQAIGVVLSGNASDGTAGLAAIRAQGGITFAQEPCSARFSEMPQSAVDAGVVDFCLPVSALGAELARLARHPYLAHGAPAGPTGAALARILARVRSTTGVDFAEHKPATVRRRIARRMALRGALEGASYLDLLGREPAEILALHDDLLLQFTSFFRDGESFDELRRVALPDIVKHKAPGDPIRAWVVGCATGEEVYSLAIALLESFDGSSSRHPILIFGSDLSAKAIETARAGIYPDGAVHGLGEDRLRRFFVRTERGWRVNAAVRELCVFARHDVARDPPFSRLDLVSCRNVLVHFGRALQRRALASVHYALGEPGYLLLGRSESVHVPGWFATAAKGGRLLRRRPGASALRPAGRAGAVPIAAAPRAPEGLPSSAGGAPTRAVDALVLAHYGPPGVAVDERLEVLEFRGRTSPYLEPPAGEPHPQLLRMARAGLATPLRLALAQARKESAPVKRTGIEIDGTGRTCDVVVLPVPGAAAGAPAFVVLFEEVPRSAALAPATSRRRAARAGAVARRALEQELVSTREQLTALAEERGEGEDALGAANGELVSANEELQSVNEELETAKEELQATNEELTTVNDELHGRNQELLLVNTDVLNLLDAIEIPIVMLDGDHRVRRFTRRAAETMALRPADVGRRITDLALPVQAPDLESWIARAIEEATLVEAEVQDRAGRWNRLQLRPRRTAGDRIDGAILSLVDIQDLKQELAAAEWARDYATRIVEAVQVPLVVLSGDLRIHSANAAYYGAFGGTAAETAGRGLFEIGGGVWDVPELRRALLAADGHRFQALEVEREFPGVGLRVTQVSGCAFPSPARTPMILLAIEDVTERRQGERRRAELLALSEQATQRAERADAAKDVFLANLSHELRTPLTAILLHGQALLRMFDPKTVERAATAIVASARRQARLVDDLLDVSRIIAGKNELKPRALDWRALVREVVETVRPEAESRSVQLTVEADGEAPPCRGDPERLQQVVANLLTNALKFTPGGGRVTVRIDALDGAARLVVADTGRGIDPTFLPHVFDRFAQEAGASRRSGLGLGLTLVNEIVKLHGGTVVAESPGRDLGATFTVVLPGRSPAAPAAG